MKKGWMILLITVTAIASGWAVTPKKYAEIDLDKDGKVSRDEYLQYRLSTFAVTDKNSDGGLDVTEYNFPAAFTRCDKDGDGRLSRDEFNVLNIQSVSRMDKDADGFLSFDELGK